MFNVRVFAMSSYVVTDHWLVSYCN